MLSNYCGLFVLFVYVVCVGVLLSMVEFHITISNVNKADSLEYRLHTFANLLSIDGMQIVAG